MIPISHRHLIERTRERLRACGPWLAALAVAGASWVHAAENFTVVKLPTVGGGEMIAIDAEDSPAVQPLGLAVDRGGKIYVSDRGRTDDATGRVYMLRGTNTPVIVMQGLEQPGDIEMTPDQRGLVIGRVGGGVQVRYLGVTVEAIGPDLPSSPRLYLKTGLGSFPGARGADGFFHFEEVLRPDQTNTTATLILINGNPPAAKPISLTDPGTGGIAGEVFLQVEF